jgi:hypothetical protein
MNAFYFLNLFFKPAFIKETILLFRSNILIIAAFKLNVRHDFYFIITNRLQYFKTIIGFIITYFSVFDDNLYQWHSRQNFGKAI